MKRRHQFSDYWMAWLNLIDGPGKSYELSSSELSYLSFLGLGEWSYRTIRFAQLMFSFGWVVFLPNFRSIPIWISFTLMIATYAALSALFAFRSWAHFHRKKKASHPRPNPSFNPDAASASHRPILPRRYGSAG